MSVSSVKHLRSILFEVMDQGRWLFRGEPRHFTTQRPSLDRDIDELGVAVGAFERRAIEWQAWWQFCNSTQHFLPQGESIRLNNRCFVPDAAPGGRRARLLERPTIDGLQVMQHYGAPTRLLDWTRSPWVALWHACEIVGDDHNRDGRIWCVDTLELEDALQAVWKKVQAPRQTDNPRELDPEVDFDRLLAIDDPGDWLTAIYSPLPFDRLERQQGAFTVAGRLGTDHCEWLGRRLQDDATVRVTIPHDWKDDLLRDLRVMGVTASSLGSPRGDTIGAGLRREFVDSDRAEFWRTVGRPRRSGARTT